MEMKMGTLRDRNWYEPLMWFYHWTSNIFMNDLWRSWGGGFRYDIQYSNTTLRVKAYHRSTRSVNWRGRKVLHICLFSTCECLNKGWYPVTKIVCPNLRWQNEITKNFIIRQKPNSRVQRPQQHCWLVTQYMWTSTRCSFIPHHITTIVTLCLLLHCKTQLSIIFSLSMSYPN